MAAHRRPRRDDADVGRRAVHRPLGRLQRAARRQLAEQLLPAQRRGRALHACCRPGSTRPSSARRPVPGRRRRRCWSRAASPTPRAWRASARNLGAVSAAADAMRRRRRASTRSPPPWPAGGRCPDLEHATDAAWQTAVTGTRAFIRDRRDDGGDLPRRARARAATRRSQSTDPAAAQQRRLPGGARLAARRRHRPTRDARPGPGAARPADPRSEPRARPRRRRWRPAASLLAPSRAPRLRPQRRLTARVTPTPTCGRRTASPPRARCVPPAGVEPGAGVRGAGQRPHHGRARGPLALGGSCSCAGTAPSPRR